MTSTHNSEHHVSFNLITGVVTFRDQTCRLCASHIEFLEYLIDAGPRGVSSRDIHTNMYLNRRDDEVPSFEIIGVFASQIRRVFREAGIMLDIVSNGGRMERNKLFLVHDRYPTLRCSGGRPRISEIAGVPA